MKAHNLKKEKLPRVLAIAPMSTGFGYTVFDSPQRLMDFGVTAVRIQKTTRLLVRFETLLNLYKPNAVVINLPNGSDKQNTTANKLTAMFAKCAAVNMIPCKHYRRDKVQQLFSIFDALTKEDIADKLIEWLPALKTYRPERRQPWEAPHIKIHLFDAAAVTCPT